MGVTLGFLTEEGSLAQHTPASLPSTVPLTWTEMLPEGLPPSNVTSSPVLAYDPVTNQTLDFVAASEGGLSSIWNFDAGVWTNVTPSGNLTQQDLTELSATFDAAEGYLLLFGYTGYNDQTSTQAETWIYSAGTWSQQHPSTEPRGTVMAGVTYDPVGSSAILVTTLYGRPDSLTWAFQAGNWAQVVTTTSPPALYGSTMAFDNSTADQEIVLFADGLQLTGPTQGFWNQTWVYRGDEWVNVTAASGPAPPGGDAAMTYDSSERVVVLEDPQYLANGTPGRTWEFANGRWSYLETPSDAAYLENGGCSFIYDPHDGYALLLGSGISAYSGNTTTQTWKLNRTDIGAPPTPTLNVTPRNLTEGAAVHITASATGGYGALALLVRTTVPGCWEIERQAGSWNCTTNGSGEAVVGFVVVDQAGRWVSVFAIVQIAPPPPPSTNWLAYAVAVGVLAAVAVVAVAVVIRHRRRPPPANATSSAPGSAGPPP